jgi:hypothetical protein
VQDLGLDRVGLGEVGIQRQRPVDGVDAILGTAPLQPVHLPVADCHQGPRFCVVRVEFGGPLANAYHGLRGADVRGLAGHVGLPRHQVIVVGLGIVGATLAYGLLLRRQQMQLAGLGDGAGNLILDREDVAVLAIVALGPQVSVAFAVDELCADPYPPSGLAHAAFQHMGHVEFGRDLRHVDVLALVAEGTVA